MDWNTACANPITGFVIEIVYYTGYMLVRVCLQTGFLLTRSVLLAITICNLKINSNERQKILNTLYLTFIFQKVPSHQLCHKRCAVLLTNLWQSAIPFSCLWSLIPIIHIHDEFGSTYMTLYQSMVIHSYNDITKKLSSWVHSTCKCNIAFLQWVQGSGEYVSFLDFATNNTL